MSATKIVACLVIVCCIGQIMANPAKGAFWKGTPLDSMVEEMRSNCASGTDSLACMKFKVINFLDTIFKKDNFQVYFVKNNILNFVIMKTFSFIVR